MLHQTKGIVLRLTRFKESSAIVNIFTEKFGVQTYIVNGLFAKRAKNKMAYLQPLNLLNLVVYYKENQNIKRIKEMQWDYMFRQIPFNNTKRCVLIFLNEILVKSIKEEVANIKLFNFLYYQIELLDNFTEKHADFIIIFIIKLSALLGFKPLPNKTDKQNYFSLSQGQFVENHILNQHQLTALQSALFYNCLTTVNNKTKLKLTKVEKAEILDLLIKYFQYHIEGFGQIRSKNILNSVLNKHKT